MKKYFWLYFICFSVCHAYAQDHSKNLLQVIPQPVSVSMQQGFFHLPRQVIILSDTGAHDIAAFLSEWLHHYTLGVNTRSTLSSSKTKSNIDLILYKDYRKELGEEGYLLKVTPQKIILSANYPKGLFYGIQTLMQLLPPASKENAATKAYTIPCTTITDYPRFGYRGLMLDVSRHFFSKEFIKKYIDEMAKYKFNVFHWHLTDDEGWRIEIKGLPQLTDVGAWRVMRRGRWNTFAPPAPGEKASDGGYYTQNDVREIIQYAQKRFITILPEIDVPAHSLALIASYPALSCTQLPYYVNPGSPFYKKDDNVLCVANDSTWLILDKIFTQVAALFPSKYIHIGGDEAFKGFWKDCPKDQALMKQEGLKSVEELQSFFVKKLEKLIISKGKKMIGWDEILEGGLAPEATVMSWRGKQGGIDAAKMGHDVIMTPIMETYLSRKQSVAALEPFAPGLVTLHTCYNFEPVPDSVDAALILGGQASLWTEHISNERHAEYMTWPRAMAIAEVLWSPKAIKDFADFAGRVEAQFPYLDAANVKYSSGMYAPLITAVKDKNDSMEIAIDTEMPGLDIYYTFDGTNPDNFYPAYRGTPLPIPAGASEIRVVTYKHGRYTGQQVNYSLMDARKSLKK